jgi:hypothetical protein
MVIPPRVKSGSVGLALILFKVGGSDAYNSTRDIGKKANFPIGKWRDEFILVVS